MPNRHSPLSLSPEEFKKIGHTLVDEVADLIYSFHEKPVSPRSSPSEIRQKLPKNLPSKGANAAALVDEATEVLKQYSTFNGHPKFWGYITAGATPIGVLAELLAAGINPNVGGWQLSPAASEIERQTIAWIADLVGYPTNCGGILVSGGNMANFVGFLAGRRAIAGSELRTQGLSSEGNQYGIYVSKETHTWIQKAADLFGHGSNSIRWIDTDDKQRMKVSELNEAITIDLQSGITPMMVVGTAGTVSTGAVDPLTEIHEVAREHNLWFHVDGAYGAFAAILPEYGKLFEAVAMADSVALDPHKWLYAPLEAGCTLVRDQQMLIDTFSYRPSYYHFDGDENDPKTSFYELGFQNSRGFKALKVWMSLRHAGRDGYEEMIRDDIHLAKILYDIVDEDPDFEAMTNELSITTFRFAPRSLKGKDVDNEFLNRLNEELLEALQHEGEAFVSNAIVNGVFALRACIVNFRTSEDDIRELPEIVRKCGSRILKNHA